MSGVSRAIARLMGIKSVGIPVLARSDEESSSLMGVDSNGDVNVTARISVIKAVNGTILEVMRHKPNRTGPDWYATHYILKEGQTLAEAIALCLLMKD
jgi:hypothetical protein